MLYNYLYGNPKRINYKHLQGFIFTGVKIRKQRMWSHSNATIIAQLSIQCKMSKK